MLLKHRLEAVWNDNKIACPNHLARWNTIGNGYLVWMNLGLWWTKGTVRKPKGRKPKGKGFSFLSRNYGIAIRIREEKNIGLDNCTCALPHHLPIWWCQIHGEVVVAMD